MDIQNWIGLQTEADLKEYKVYKKKDSPNYSYLTTTTSTTYTDNSEEAVTGPYVANETVAYYKIVAVDKSNYVSPYSNEVSSRVEGEAQSKQSWAGNSSAPDNFSFIALKLYSLPVSVNPLFIIINPRTNTIIAETFRIFFVVL